MLRSSEDASLLLQALLDVVGDAALDMVTEFRDELTILEGRVLAKPSMLTVRHLHSLSAQLLLLKSTISPLQSLIQSLRYADEVKASSAARPQTTTAGNGNGKLRHVGFISHEAKVYLSDTLDHIDSVVSSLDLFSGISENLIGELPLPSACRKLETIDNNVRIG